MTIRRVWRAFGLRPHRSERFQLSNDPLLVEKVRDVVGLYLNPPENAIVLCVDEKTEVQALERSQPVLPMDLGQPERQTSDYFRHGTVDLFAALTVATGEVFSKCYAQHRAKEFINFLGAIDANVPAAIGIHVVFEISPPTTLLLSSAADSPTPATPSTALHSHPRVVAKSSRAKLLSNFNRTRAPPWVAYEPEAAPSSDCLVHRGPQREVRSHSVG